MRKAYSIGIDLHGTLLDEKEELKKENVNKLKEAIKKVKRFANVFTCTGNDLLFVKQKLAPVFSLFDGFVLETGCVVSYDGKTEKVLTSRRERDRISELYELCLEQEYAWVTDANRRRLTTISLFTREPEKRAAEVKELVRNNGFGEKVTVTYSSVAVDIIPAGYNKFTGLDEITKKTRTIGIADSMNDALLVLNADYAFVPQNASKQLLKKIGKKKRVINVNDWTRLNKNTVIKASEKESSGVIQLLEKLCEKVG